VQPPPRAAPRPPTGDLLIVENDARIVELLQWFLSRRGHQVRAVASFAEARLRIAERRPDLLLSDVELGRENARTLLPELAREGLLPPTLVVSGFVDHELAAELLAVPGVQAVIHKPFEFERLERWIDEFFQRVPAG
jgi:two-component system, OmpR family, phosphate regulon response regulator PhoB